MQQTKPSKTNKQKRPNPKHHSLVVVGLVRPPPQHGEQGPAQVGREGDDLQGAGVGVYGEDGGGAAVGDCRADKALDGKGCEGEREGREGGSG